MSNLQVKRVNPKARLPFKARDGDAGYDLFSLNGGIVPARGQLLVSTGISIRMPTSNDPNYSTVGFIKSRSGLSLKHNIEVGGGVIDDSYRGIIHVMLRNLSDIDFEFDQHAKIAQLVILPIWTVPIQEVQELGDTDRGTLGFGSSGI